MLQAKAFKHPIKNQVLHAPLVAWAILAISLGITLVVWNVVKSGVEQASQHDFKNVSDEVRGAIEQRMLAYEQVLRGGLGLFHASNEVSREEWKAYVDALKIETTFPGIQGIGFSLKLRPDELKRHIQKIRAEGFADYAIRPAGEREEYTAIIYLEPFNERNKQAFGYDMFSEATRHAAMVTARDTGQSAISGKVILKQEITQDVQAGFLMYLPLYKAGAVTATPEERRRALIGYVYSPFRMKDLMAGILGGAKSGLRLEVFDGENYSPDTLMLDYFNINDINGQTNSPPLFSNITPIHVQAHTWTLRISSTPAFEEKIDTAKPRIIATSGVIISALFSAFAWLLASHRKRALAIARTMTHALREREAFIHAILTNAADGIITTNERGSILSFNNAAEVIFGYSEAEILGKPFNLLLPEPYRSQNASFITEYLKSNETDAGGKERSVTGLRKNKEQFPLDLAVSEVREEGRRIFAAIARDITERKKAEEALRLSEERFDLAIRGANDGLWDWDIASGQAYFSPRWKEMLGYEEDEISGHIDEWKTRLHPDDAAQVMSRVQAHLDGHTAQYQSEHRVRHKDGYYLWILDRGIAQRDEQGQAYRMVAIHTDISQRKQAERLKSEFVSTVSHELRTPLTSIRGSLGLIAGGAAGTLPEHAKGLIEIAARNSDRLLALINDILDIEKIQSGTLKFHCEPLNTVTLVEQAIEINQGYAEKYGVNFVLRSNTRDAIANVDASRFTQVLSNLLSNAAKFSKTGDNVEVEVARNGGVICVSVTDHGIGIPEHFHDRVFDKFTQADSSDTRHKGGTGLGLSISKSIIEKMNGYIDFQTKPGKGTRFFFTLPEWQSQDKPRPN